jgi:hypothetical protein
MSSRPFCGLVIRWSPVKACHSPTLVIHNRVGHRYCSLIALGLCNQ